MKKDLNLIIICVSIIAIILAIIMRLLGVKCNEVILDTGIVVLLVAIVSKIKKNKDKKMNDSKDFLD